MSKELEVIKSRLNYDPDTGLFTWVNLMRHGKVVNGDHAGCISDQGYTQIRVNGKTYKAHRLAFLFMKGQMPTNEVDHINHDRSDNRWSNLRESTHHKNQKNKGIAKNNTSGHVGIGQIYNGKWRAQIKVNKKTIHLGNFMRLADAVEARKSAELQHGFHFNHGAINV